AGGIAVSPSVAITIANITTNASVDDSGTLLTLSGKLTVSATQHAHSNSIAKADAAGSGDAAVGLSLGLGIINDVVQASIGRNVTANGDVEVDAIGTADADTEASASAKGGDNKDDNAGKGDVNKKGDDQVKLGNDAAAADNGGDNSKKSNKTKTKD